MSIKNFVAEVRVSAGENSHCSSGYLFNANRTDKSFIITSKHSVCVEKNLCSKVKADVNSCRTCEINVDPNSLEIITNNGSKSIKNTFISKRTDVAIIEIAYEKDAPRYSFTHTDCDKYVFWHKLGSKRCLLNRPDPSAQGFVKYNIESNVIANLADKERELRGSSGSLIFKEFNENTYYPVAIVTEDGGGNDIGAELINQELLDELNQITHTILFESSSDKDLKTKILSYYKNNFNDISFLVGENKKNIDENYIDLNIIDVNTTEDESIDIKQLIKNSTISNSTKALIYGKAGTGKSTLCQYIAYKWATGLHYQEFEYIIYLALCDWKKNGIAYAIKNKYFELDSDVDLVNFIQKNSSKILFLFDGYDELINDKKKDFQNEISKYSLVNYIITTRSYGLKINDFDVFGKFETIGFTDEHVYKYIDLFFEKGADRDSIKSFLSSSNNFQQIAHNPLILEIICSLWKQNKITSSTSIKTLTMTLLYEKVVEYMFYEYTEHNATEYIQDKRGEIFSYLGKIALDGLRSQTSVLDKAIINQEMENLRDFISNFVLKAGFLKSDMQNKSVLLNSYQFLHLTFQEFFAARYVSKLAECEIRDIVSENKFNPYMQVFFTFLAGLLEKKEILLSELNKEPRDLLGFNISMLYLDCLNELNEEQRNNFISLEKLSITWLQYSINNNIALEFILSKVYNKDLLIYIINELSDSDNLIRFRCFDILVKKYRNEILNIVETKIFNGQNTDLFINQIKIKLINNKLFDESILNNIELVIKDGLYRLNHKSLEEVFYPNVTVNKNEIFDAINNLCIYNNKYVATLQGMSDLSSNEKPNNLCISTEDKTSQVLIEELHKENTLEGKISIIEDLVQLQSIEQIAFSRIDEAFQEYVQSISQDESFEIYTSIKLAIKIYKFNTGNQFLIDYIVNTIDQKIEAIEYESEIKDIMYLLDTLAFYKIQNQSIINLLYKFISMNIDIKYKIDIAKGLYLNGNRDKMIVKILLDAILHSNTVWNTSYDQFWKEDIVGLLCTKFDDFSNNQNITNNFKATMGIECFIKYINEFNLLQEADIFKNNYFTKLFINAFILDNKPLFMNNNELVTVDSSNSFVAIKCDDKNELLERIEGLVGSKIFK